MAIVKEEDRLKPVAEKIIRHIHEGKIKGIYASVAVLQEIIFWFFNRGLLKELILALNIITHIKNIEWVELTPEICITASLLMDKYGIGPFDAYHAATAIQKDKTILSTEHVYDRIKGIRRINPKEFIKSLQ